VKKKDLLGGSTIKDLTLGKGRETPEILFSLIKLTFPTDSLDRKEAMRKDIIIAAGLCVAALFIISMSRAEGKTGQNAMEPRISVVTLGVADLPRSYLFYKSGLGFPTKMTPDGGIVLFATRGTRLFLYPYAKLAEDCRQKAPESGRPRDVFAGVTFGHCTRKRERVDAILLQAEKAGGKIVKPAKTASWGGYSGYFADPDGYLWEVAYSDSWKFNPDGSVVVDEESSLPPEPTTKAVTPAGR